MSHDEVSQHLADLRVQCVFNIERAPWLGGIFQRLVRSTKWCLKEIIGRAKLTYEELTVILETES
jgi:hypothetical protein